MKIEVRIAGATERWKSLVRELDFEF